MSEDITPETGNYFGPDGNEKVRAADPNTGQVGMIPVRELVPGMKPIFTETGPLWIAGTLPPEQFALTWECAYTVFCYWATAEKDESLSGGKVHPGRASEAFALIAACTQMMHETQTTEHIHKARFAVPLKHLTPEDATEIACLFTTATEHLGLTTPTDNAKT